MFSFYSLHLQALLVYLLHWNVGRHFKLILCLHRAQFKTINQVLDYILAFIPALKTNAVTNIRLDSFGWRSDIMIEQKEMAHRQVKISKETGHFVLIAYTFLDFSIFPA